MKTKTLGVFGIASLMLFLCLTFASAATTFTLSTHTLTFGTGDTSKEFTLTNGNATSIINVQSTINIQGIVFNVAGTPPGIGDTSTFTLTPTTSINYSSLDFGKSISGNLTITAGSESEKISVKIENTQFCDYSNPGDLEVKSIDIENTGIGDEDNWYPFDVLNVEVEIENNGDEDVKDITLEWGVYDSDGLWIIEPVSEDDFDVDEDESEIIAFTIDLDDDLDVSLDELKDGSYSLYVRATGEGDDSGDITCASDFETADMVIEDDYVIFKDVEIIGTPFCGSTVQAKAELVNIGSDDQEDITVSIYNKDLGLDEKMVISSLDAFDDKKLTFEFSIPTDLVEKNYPLLLEVFDEDGDAYENSNDDVSEYSLPLAVSGNCVKTPKATVYASLESGGKAGQEMVIKASVTNLDSTSKTFTITAADYSNWAELVSIEPSALTLNPNEAKDILITLNVDSDAAAKSSFNILLADEKGNKLTQPVSVTVDKGFSLSSLFNGKGYIWAIVLLNIILIVVIIVIALKVARRK